MRREYRCPFDLAGCENRARSQRKRPARWAVEDAALSSTRQAAWGRELVEVVEVTPLLDEPDVQPSTISTPTHIAVASLMSNRTQYRAAQFPGTGPSRT
jgi:hypothetical protein